MATWKKIPLGVRNCIHLLILSLLIISCGNTRIDSISPVPSPEEPENQPIQRDEDQDEKPGADIQAAEKIIHRDLPVITSENILFLELDHKFFPYFPEIVHISPDGHTIAVGDYSGIKVIDLDSGEEKISIDMHIPECQFGMNRFFQLNYDGSYLAVAARNGVQVWQVGGELVYESRYLDGYRLDLKTCGKDVPQLGLSPDGTQLVHSGIQFLENEFESYFQVIDILKNEIVFDWDGQADSLHGSLYNFPSLGFSSNGAVLQTFDPSRFMKESKEIHSAFRFWDTRDWKELDRDSEEVRKAFSAGEMQFTLSEKDQIVVYNKTNGAKITSINISGCEMEFPCPVKFSNDGETAAVLRWGNDLNFKREWIHKKLVLVDVSSGLEISSHKVLMRNTDGFFLDDTGEVFFKNLTNGENSSWWTHADYFSGFRIIDGQTVVFTPQVHNFAETNLNFSGSCTIDLETYDIQCLPALLFNGDSEILVENKIDGFSIYRIDGEDQILISDIRNPPSETDDLWQFRLLAYIEEKELGVFCMDKNLREETCVIMDFGSNEVLYEQIDLKGFIYSIKNETGAYIDKDKKALFLFDTFTKKNQRMRVYQAVALPILPAILPADDEMIYMVQSLENPKNLYLERINSDEGKVIKRLNVEGIRDKEILSLAANPKSGLLAVADADGFLYLIDPDIENVIHTLKISDEEIIDLTFSAEGDNLILMERTGVIQVLAVKYKNR